MTQKHAHLPITFAELGALLGTEQLMKNHVIVHVPPDVNPHDDAHEFNMNVTCKVKGCASIGCIGGTMAQIMGLSAYAADDYVRNTKSDVRSYIGDVPKAHSDALHQLFFPPDNHDFGKVTVRMALNAIKQFRETGTVDWYKIPGFAKTQYGED
jgi:hypothetical protein